MIKIYLFLLDVVLDMATVMAAAMGMGKKVQIVFRLFLFIAIYYKG